MATGITAPNFTVDRDALADAVAWVARAAGTAALPSGSTVLITLSGRGDKDAACLKELIRGRR